MSYVIIPKDNWEDVYSQFTTKFPELDIRGLDEDMKRALAYSCLHKGQYGVESPTGLVQTFIVFYLKKDELSYSDRRSLETLLSLKLEVYRLGM